jgi:hypothetical protein
MRHRNQSPLFGRISLRDCRHPIQAQRDHIVLAFEEVGVRRVVGNCDAGG